MILGSHERGHHMATQPSKGSSQDPTRVDSRHYTVELEDDKVRVLRVKYGPGEKSVMHSHPALIGVMLTDSNIRFTYPDGRTETISGKAGQVLNFPAIEHLPENIGDALFEAVLIELKS
jgi:quercetin dioxygenase-like cupin family protein